MAFAPSAAFASVASTEPFTTFRFTSISFRDPHFVSNQSGFCIDVTGLLNSDLQAKLSQDQDHDGFIDAGGIMIFKGLDPAGAGGQFELVSAACDTVLPNTCLPDSFKAAIDAIYSYSNNGSNPCLAPIASALRPDMRTRNFP